MADIILYPPVNGVIRFNSPIGTRFGRQYFGTDWAADADRCFVLLEPNRGFASSRVAGRLRLDLLIAGCSVKGGQLKYSRMRNIGNKQGSVIFPKLSLKGDSVVVMDVYDVSSQQEDQIDIEHEKKEIARACV